MNLLEQLALGWHCPLRALRECFRAALWRPWWPLLAGYVVLLLAIAFAAHPLLSAFMAPAIRMAAGDDALRYPELFRRLPGLWRWAQLAFDALVTPFAAGYSALLWSERFHGVPLHPAHARAEMLHRAPKLLLAMLPVTLATVLGNAALDSLASVRMSGLSRALAPQAIGALLFFVRAACFYAVPMVMLDCRGSRRALLVLPGTLGSVRAGAGRLPVAALVQMPSPSCWRSPARWPNAFRGRARRGARFGVRLGRARGTRLGRGHAALPEFAAAGGGRGMRRAVLAALTLFAAALLSGCGDEALWARWQAERGLFHARAAAARRRPPVDDAAMRAAEARALRVMERFRLRWAADLRGARRPPGGRGVGARGAASGRTGRPA
jgi:hypothetical protein